MFNKVSYRRGVIEGVILYTLGRFGAVITPAFFPDWVFVAAPLLFLVLQYLLGPVWATCRIVSTKRERLSKRFWLLGPRLAVICLGIDIIITLTCGLPVNALGGLEHGNHIGSYLVQHTDYRAFVACSMWIGHKLKKCVGKCDFIDMHTKKLRHLLCCPF